MSQRRPKAADIDTLDLLHRIANVSRPRLAAGYAGWVFTWDMDWYDHLPWKVVAAKLSRLVRKGLLDGCTCGCRGDFTLTEQGNAILAAHTPPPTAAASPYPRRTTT